MYFVYVKSWLSGEPHVVLNECSTLQEASDCVATYKESKDVGRVLLIEGKVLSDWTPETERELTSDELQKSTLEN